jgi:hypothetical protein
MEFSELNTLMCLSRFIIVFVLQKNMEAVKVEPDSDDEAHHMPSQDEYCITDEKDYYPVHAEFFVVKSEREVSSSLYRYLFDYRLAQHCHMHVLCRCRWLMVCFTETSECRVMSCID